LITPMSGYGPTATTDLSGAMAIQTHIQPARPRFAGLATSVDRAKAFRAAKRHSALVMTLRWILPLSAVAMAGLYFLPSRIEVKVGDAKVSIKEVDLSGGALKMVNPRMHGVNEKQGVYDVQAAYATQQVGNTDLMYLNTINAEITSKAGEKTTLTAPSGIYARANQELTFDNGVTIGGEAGLAGKLKTATAYMGEHKLISKDPVDLSFHKNTIQADTMTLYTSESRAIFEGRVKVHIERNEGASRP
jgi:lipopolysaccharide export system protein LptC